MADVANFITPTTSPVSTVEYEEPQETEPRAINPVSHDGEHNSVTPRRDDGENLPHIPEESTPPNNGWGGDVDKNKENSDVDSSPVYNKTTEPVEERQSCCSWLRRKPRREDGHKGARTGGKDCVFGHNARQWYLLLVIHLGTLTSSFAVCLFPPFFPKIAQDKGQSATVYGLIIGTNCLTAFLVTPIVGKNLKKIGLKFAFVAGCFCSGGCCVLTGFLEWFPGGLEFALIAVCIRAVHATANSGILTSSFALIALEFPDSVAKMFAFTRTTMNVAQMFGPVVGGALYELGGFKMPFLIMGCLQMSMALVSGCLLHDYTNVLKEEQKSSINMWRMFSIPTIWVSFLTFIFSTMSNGFLSVTLEPLVLRKFNLSPFYVGLLFGLKDGANSIASPVWGWACDRLQRVKLFIFLASLFAFTSFFFYGPFPGIDIHHSLELVIMLLIFNGFGIGGQQVAGVVDAMKEAVYGGFPEGPDTNGLVAGLWSSLSGAGRFISRGGSGFLIDYIGFRKSSVILVFLHGLIILITGVHILVRGTGTGKYSRQVDEEDPCSPSPSRHNGVHTAGNNTIGTIFTTSPSEPLTTKAITIDIGYTLDLGDNVFCGSAPLPTTSRIGRTRTQLRTSPSMEYK